MHKRKKENFNKGIHYQKISSYKTSDKTTKFEVGLDTYSSKHIFKKKSLLINISLTQPQLILSGIQSDSKGILIEEIEDTMFGAS